jgi:hypothetical protein
MTCSARVTKEMMKAINKAEKDRSRETRKALTTFDQLLDIDKVKIPTEMIVPKETQEPQPLQE